MRTITLLVLAALHNRGSRMGLGHGRVDDTPDARLSGPQDRGSC